MKVVKRKCVHMMSGLVSYRLCTRHGYCLTCEFAQMVQDKKSAERRA